MQKVTNQVIKNRPAMRTNCSLMVALTLCFSQFAVAQSSDIDASVSFNVPISLSCTSNLTFGNISIISTGGASTEPDSIYNVGNKIAMLPSETTATGGLVSSGNVVVTGESFGSCQITGVAEGSTLNLNFNTNTTTISGGAGGDTGLTVTPILIAADGTTVSGTNNNVITITGTDPYGLDATAAGNGAYSYDPDSDTFTFQVGGQLSFDDKEELTLAELAGLYTGAVSVQVEL